MEMIRAIIFAKDLKRMTAFYRDGLGLRVVTEDPASGWVELDAGGVSLALHGIPPEIAATIDVTDPPRPRGDTPIKLVFRPPDPDAARARLTALGAVMSEPRPWGACDGLDPEGNVFQLARE